MMNLKNMFKRFEKQTVCEINGTCAIDYSIERYRKLRDIAYTMGEDELFAEYVEKIEELKKEKRA